MRVCEPYSGMCVRGKFAIACRATGGVVAHPRPISSPKRTEVPPSVHGSQTALAKGSDLAHRNPGFVEVGCHDVRLFRCWSHMDMRRAIALLAGARGRVATGRMTAAECNELETIIGLHYNPDGLIACDALAAEFDPVAACTYDWVHNMLQDRSACVPKRKQHTTESVQHCND